MSCLLGVEVQGVFITWSLLWRGGEERERHLDCRTMAQLQPYALASKAHVAQCVCGSVHVNSLWQVDDSTSSWTRVGVTLTLFPRFLRFPPRWHACRHSDSYQLHKMCKIHHQ